MNQSTQKSLRSTVDLTPSSVFQTLNYTPILEKRITDPLYQILFFQHHNAPESNCYITLCKKRNNGKWIQRNFKPSEIEMGLKKFGKRNVFFSMNNFYIPLRQERWIKEIRSLHVDLDFYKIEKLSSFSPEMIRQKIDLELVDEGIIPKPSGTIFSGNGLQLIWLLEPVAGINQKAKRLWKKLQNLFNEKLEYFGSDFQANDLPRVFRPAGSINYKEEHGMNKVYFVHHHTHLYSMEHLANDYLPELIFPEKNKKHPRKKKKSSGEVKHLFNGYSLNKARMEDLETLVRLRKGEFPKMRQFAVWLYRIFSLQVTQSPEEALALALRFNSTLSDPLPDDEVKWHTNSANKKWLKEKDGKPHNELIRGFTFSNESIISTLKISMDEQKHLKTIIGKEEKKIRSLISNEKYRRNKGQIPREEYLLHTSRKKEAVLAEAIIKHPDASIRQLAAITGLSKSTVQRLKSKINS